MTGGTIGDIAVALSKLEMQARSVDEGLRYHRRKVESLERDAENVEAAIAEVKAQLRAAIDA